MDRKKIPIVLGVAAFLLLGVLYLCMNQRQTEGEVITEHFEDTAENVTEEVPDTEKTKEEKVYVHICGAVKKQGVYVFDGEPHIIDVVKKAGGFTKKADQTSVNLAETVADGTQIVIAKKSKKNTSDTSGSPQNDKVNINTASAEELMTLSGIGESKAAQILSYRETNGKFQKIEDIMNISGIKEGVFSKIKNDIMV